MTELTVLMALLRGVLAAAVVLAALAAPGSLLRRRWPRVRWLRIPCGVLAALGLAAVMYLVGGRGALGAAEDYGRAMIFATLAAIAGGLGAVLAGKEEK